MHERLLDDGLAFFSALFLSVFLTPCIIFLANRLGLVAEPREDRWHRNPTALLGGIAIFFAFILPFGLLGERFQGVLPLVFGGCAMFILGLADDLWDMSPQNKFVAQLVVSALGVAGGIQMAGFEQPLVTFVVSLFWLVGITNAINILDNMDGLAAGITLVASAALWGFGLLYGNVHVGRTALVLAGAALGFWVYNFNPARIFMGDCGSLFLGFTLGALSLLATGSVAPSHASGGYALVTNVLLVLMVPMAVLIIPLFDTALVSFTRVQHGRPFYKGGRDHTSHRLVLLGFSEKRTVITLMGCAALISILTLYLAGRSAEGVIVLLGVVGVIALFFGVFLTQTDQQIYDEKKNLEPGKSRKGLLSMILNKKQMLQAAVDTLLLVLAHMTAYLLRYEGVIDQANWDLIEKSLPLIIPVKLCCFWAFGLYRGQWRYVSINDFWQLLKGVVTGTLLSLGVLLFLYRFNGFSRVVFINDAVWTIIYIGGVRYLLRLFKEYFDIQEERKRTTPILIIGAGDGGDLFLRELRKNKSHDFLPVGFIDDDPAKKGQVIHGIKVLGNREAIPSLVKKYGVKKVFVAIMSASEETLAAMFDICHKIPVECQRVCSLLFETPELLAGKREIKPVRTKKGTVISWPSRKRR